MTVANGRQTRTSDSGHPHVVVLTRAEWDDARLDRLLQLHMHAWSALVPVPIDEQARFVYTDLPLYRDRAAHAAFLFLDHAGRTPVGLALTARDEDQRSHVKEFFVIAGARRRGFGLEAARTLFASQPGCWTFTVRPENAAGLAFWDRACPHADVCLELGADGIESTRFRWRAG